MKKIVNRIAALAALATFGAAPAQAQETYIIDGSVWDHFQGYLDKIGHGRRPGAYAITTDGYGAYYVWCEETRCMAGRAYSTEAVEFCEREYGTECVTFAIRDEIKVKYEIRKVESGGGSSDTPAPQPAPAAKIDVPAAVQAEIDAYLRNAKSSGKAWALAIAKDGSEVASANCPKTGGGGYFGGSGPCDLNSGGAQELANREAIKRCGGPAKCVLLYVGTQRWPSTGIDGEIPSSDSPTAVSSKPTPPPVAEITVSTAVQADIDKYLNNAKSSGKAWALAIAKDGSEVASASCATTGGGGYFGGSGPCDLNSGGAQELANREAIKRCGGPAKCVLLYVGAQRQPSSGIDGQVPSSGSPAAGSSEPTPAPVAKIAVSAAVQADIDKYLNNAKSSGKAWALAIAKDGSEVASANCPSNGSWSGGAACVPVNGGPQELANREAIKRCGGPTECVLLYVGAQKAPNIEVAAQ